MVKKINIVLVIVSVVLLIYGIVLVNKRIAFKETYGGNSNKNNTLVELQIFEEGTAKTNLGNRYYEIKEDGLSGDTIIDLYDYKLTVVNFYKLEYIEWDYNSQSNITVCLTCSSILTRVCVVFVLDGVLLIYFICCGIKTLIKHHHNKTTTK